MTMDALAKNNPDEAQGHLESIKGLSMGGKKFKDDPEYAAAISYLEAKILGIVWVIGMFAIFMVATFTGDLLGGICALIAFMLGLVSYPIWVNHRAYIFKKRWY